MPTRAWPLRRPRALPGGVSAAVGRARTHRSELHRTPTGPSATHLSRPNARYRNILWHPISHANARLQDHRHPIAHANATKHAPMRGVAGRGRRAIPRSRQPARGRRHQSGTFVVNTPHSAAVSAIMHPISHVTSASAVPGPARRARARRVLIYNNLVGSVFMTFMSTTNNSTPGEARRRLVHVVGVSAAPRVRDVPGAGSGRTGTVAQACLKSHAHTASLTILYSQWTLTQGRARSPFPTGFASVVNAWACTLAELRVVHTRVQDLQSIGDGRRTTARRAWIRR